MRTTRKEQIAHVMALLLVVGYLALATLAMLGYVRVTDPTTASIVSQVLNSIVTLLVAVGAYYYGVEAGKSQGVDPNEKPGGDRDEKPGA